MLVRIQNSPVYLDFFGTLFWRTWLELDFLDRLLGAQDDGSHSSALQDAPWILPVPIPMVLLLSSLGRGVGWIESWIEGCSHPTQ